MPVALEQLRQAREKQNLTVHQVAEALKVRADQVKAIEEGQYSVFPAPVYVRGFIRSYAKYLKIDDKALLASVNESLGEVPKFKETQIKSGSPTTGTGFFYTLSQVNWVIVLVVSVVLIAIAGSVAGYRAWEKHKRADQKLELGPGLYTPKTKPLGETLPLPNK